MPPLASPSWWEAFSVLVTWEQGGRTCPVPAVGLQAQRGGRCGAAKGRMLWSRESSRPPGDPGAVGPQEPVRHITAPGC